mmetsp:Transcript_9675/g.13331  ORF Transcript_9675/g.13331 Transcript_9675/m.13331 type:complete len:301 (-) Transcript_9675:1124-2026(-)|eukprot:CAMPEP_0168561442 /NCGR_PEP_ID=MMETSP0413-20121227/11597_1 /TAXON_ID=136452 /ORGANISM="Filamoeba nolandi, Strain NC-AS-23-1" /LENGTH=300 /DNA_ID=CAMNT_0008592813 /DNA_START=52 /DNA_END=954 /DNA_ORIENTATION=-
MNRVFLFVALCLGLAAAFRNYEEFQTVLPGMWQGTATSLMGTTRTVQFVFTSDGHYSCHVLTEDTAEIDDWSGASCFEEGTDYDSWMKTYSFNRERQVIDYIDGSLNLVDVEGNEMQSDVDLVVATEFNGKDQLFFRVKSQRDLKLRTFFTLVKVASEEDVVPCSDYCGGDGYCYFFSGVCSNDVIYDSWSMDSPSSDEGGLCLVSIFIIIAVLSCLCCCCRRMCRRSCKNQSNSRCVFSCRNNTPVQPQVPADPYPGFVYMPMFPSQAPSAPMYMPVTEAAPVPMPPPYVMVPMMAPEH